MKYFYTAISEPSQGLPHFVSVGYMDDQLFSYYDSNSRRVKPQVSWIEKVGKEDPQYWDRNTERSRGDEEVFRENLETLRSRYNQSEGLHTWQNMYGCELWRDGSKGGFDQYGYEGRTFLSFDKETLTWVAPEPQAQITQRKWDALPGYNQREKAYLEEICIEWLEKHLSYGKETLLRTEARQRWRMGWRRTSAAWMASTPGRSMPPGRGTGRPGCRTPSMGASSHSLKYFSTAVSEPSQGLPQYITVGQVDGQVFVHYDSHSRRMQPRVSWIEKVGKEDPQYWERETQRERGSEETFRETLVTVRSRYNQSEGLHTWQSMYGCELQADGSKRGFLQYGYDGRTFLTFDKENLTWMAPDPQAQITQRKWDAVPGYNQRWKAYLEEECIEWLGRYLSYGNETLLRTEPPVVTVRRKTEVTVRGKREVEDRMVILVCHVYGFYPNDLIASWMRDGEVLEEDTFRGSLAPNADGTYYYWLSAWIDPNEQAGYQCHVEHVSLKKPLDLALEGERLQGGKAGLFGRLGGGGRGIWPQMCPGWCRCRDQTIELTSGDGNYRIPSQELADPDEMPSDPLLGLPCFLPPAPEIGFLLFTIPKRLTEFKGQKVTVCCCCKKEVAPYFMI
ncbi:hypothetical protein L345_13940, partial [Ophiophagus hannah]